MSRSRLMKGQSDQRGDRNGKDIGRSSERMRKRGVLTQENGVIKGGYR